MGNFFTFSPVDVSTSVIVFNLFLAAAISFYIAWIYKKTHSGLSYSQSFFTTIALMAPISMVIIMIVQNNIYGALGLLGAFSLIRFRTIVKETRDISFVFFALVEGVTIGSSHYTIAIISTIFISVLAVLLFRFRFGSVSNSKNILMLVSGNLLDEKELHKAAESKNVALKLLSMRKMDQVYEYSFSTHSKDTNGLGELVKILNEKFTLQSFDIISGKDTVEY